MNLLWSDPIHYIERDCLAAALPQGVGDWYTPLTYISSLLLVESSRRLGVFFFAFIVQQLFTCWNVIDIAQKKNSSLFERVWLKYQKLHKKPCTEGIFLLLLLLLLTDWLNDLSLIVWQAQIFLLDPYYGQSRMNEGMDHTRILCPNGDFVKVNWMVLDKVNNLTPLSIVSNQFSIA